jgi:predicted outer membrane repeat protein
MQSWGQKSGAVAVACAAALFTSAIHATTIYVDDDCPGGDGSELDPYCSIQTAIDNAVDTDEIVVAPGGYFETINFDGKAVWLRSSDGPEVTIIDGTGALHVVQCMSGEGPDTVLDGFTVTGGAANGDIFTYPDTVGGGMLNWDDSNPAVTDCTFSGNSASGGGGMYNGGFSPGSSPTVTDCKFTDNWAEFGGGGMFNAWDAGPTVTDCRFEGNSAGNDGGGILTEDGNPTINDSRFCGNTPDQILGDWDGDDNTFSMLCPPLRFDAVTGWWDAILNPPDEHR